MSQIFENEQQEELTIDKEALEPPPFYRVILNNDDYTPMDFVVEILCLFFSMDKETATQVMLTIHCKGKATCGVYPRDIAETKCEITNQFARENEYPLLCSVEKA